MDLHLLTDAMRSMITGTIWKKPTGGGQVQQKQGAIVEGTDSDIDGDFVVNGGCS